LGEFPGLALASWKMAAEVQEGGPDDGIGLERAHRLAKPDACVVWPVAVAALATAVVLFAATVTVGRLF
jgi:hypothetical protein